MVGREADSKLTGGIGADLAVDTAGSATLNKTVQATRHGGRISLMGVLGFDGRIDIGAILEKRITLQGIYVGSVATLRGVVQAGIKPQMDRVFPFDQANAAYDALRKASHFGKVVIQITR
jgi:threonine dehydrogenase-like Zn-dependent dehydrogenase